MSVWNKEVFNKMLDFLEDVCYDVLSCEVNLQKDVKNLNNKFIIEDEDTKQTFLKMTEAINSINTLRTFNYDDYNDEKDIIIKQNY